MAVHRHPDLRNLSVGTFDEVLRTELEHSYGRDYSELHRLVPPANLHEGLKPIVEAAFKLYESRIPKQRIPGPFCSELHPIRI
jgi:hypothetical protein